MRSGEIHTKTLDQFDMIEFYSTSLMTPVGDITVFEEDGHIIVVEWGQVPGGTSTPLLEEARDQLSAYFSGNLTAFDLPLKPEGSVHQQKVWDAMCAIEYGQTRTYGDIAKDLESSPRAVGGACGRNPIPIIIPCHRIVGANGKLTGYSGGDGIETKTKLLRMEEAVLKHNNREK